jgi:membrane protease YdiL (CAAX protease family)
MIVGGGAPVLAAYLLTARTQRLGLGLGNVRRGLVVLAAGIPIACVCGGLLGVTQGGQWAYGGVALSASLVLGDWLPRIVSVETAFRGAFLFGLQPQITPAGAAGLSVIPYALVHLDKPWQEALGSIPVGLGLCAAALYCGSIWYGTLLHFVGALAVPIVATRM